MLIMMKKSPNKPLLLPILFLCRLLHNKYPNLPWRNLKYLSKILNICTNWMNSNPSYIKTTILSISFWKKTICLHFDFLFYNYYSMTKEDHPYFFQITSASSILAGVIGKLFCHPIDTIKSRLQVNTAHYKQMNVFGNFKSLLFESFRKEGLRGNYFWYKWINFRTLSRYRNHLLYSHTGHELVFQLLWIC